MTACRKAAGPAVAKVGLQVVLDEQAVNSTGKPEVAVLMGLDAGDR
jgi:hypothetical protein